MPQTTERQVVLALPSMSPKLTYENLPPRLVWDLHASSISHVLYPGFPFNRSWFQSQCHNYSCSLIIRAWQTLAHHTQFWVIIQNTQVVTWETARQAYKNASVGFYFPFKLPIRCWLYLLQGFQVLLSYSGVWCNEQLNTVTVFYRTLVQGTAGCTLLFNLVKQNFC